MADVFFAGTVSLVLAAAVNAPLQSQGLWHLAFVIWGIGYFKTIFPQNAP